MTDTIEEAIILAARECRKKQTAYFRMRRYMRGPGGSKVTQSMVYDALAEAKSAEATLDRLLAQHDKGRSLFRPKEKEDSPQ